ncbi:hypothetical protein EJ03DRAFT_348827 [Teratosphaeria nubilosa]|uniref:Uncharacterized protein n=1 Tax=Teratosphaeria nubilosa TaxID=161662 RepID=A0A6G1LIM5_9PEZI|nr:hypothetical protein EJ03DRAFT_348827 [Teratosphaeria nubilosa]
MADHLSNGSAAAPADIIMKEEPSTEAAMDGIQQADPTDPQPPPQPVAIAPAPARQVAAVPTPPAVSGASTNRPGSMPPAPSQLPTKPSQLPTKPIPHGGPTRQYLNMNVTPHLLEGMKWLAANEPEKPLQWLADFLKRRSEEVEGA